MIYLSQAQIVLKMGENLDFCDRIVNPEAFVCHASLKQEEMKHSKKSVLFRCRNSIKNNTVTCVQAPDLFLGNLICWLLYFLKF